MREFRSVSASQLYDFRDCRRLWWFGSVLGLEKEQRASASLGTEIHAHLQAYLDDGTKPPDTESGRIARAGLSLLPEPGTVYTEVKIKDEERAWPRPDILGVPVNGIVDVLGLTDDYPLVLDHKSMSDLKWAKSKADLLEDPQGIIYGRFALGVVEQMGAAADCVTFGHVVYLTRGGPLAKKTTVTLTREHIEARWKDSLEPDVRGMKEVAKARTPLDVPGNRESCNKYGGCHFRDRCRALGMAVDVEVPAFMARSLGKPPAALTPPGAHAMSGVHVSTLSPESPVTASVPATDPMAVLRALKAKRAAEAAASGQVPPTGPAPENAQQPTPPPADAGSAGEAKPSGDAKAFILAKYGIKPKAHDASEAGGANGIVPGDAPPQVSRLASGEAGTGAASGTADERAGAGEGGQKTVPVVRKPPGFAAKLAALQWTPEQVARMLPDAMREAIDGRLDGRAYSVRNDGTIYQPGVGEVAGKPEEAEESAPAPAARPEPAPAAQVALVDCAPVSEGATLVVVKAAPAEAAPRLVLYVDCVPEKGRDRPYQMLEELIAPLLPVAVEMHNKSAKRDEEKADFYSLIPYNRGPGYVASLLLKNPPEGAVVCNTRMPATSACLEVLVPMADAVVRAIR